MSTGNDFLKDVVALPIATSALVPVLQDRTDLVAVSEKELEFHQGFTN